MSISSDEKWVEFARAFLGNRIETFTKDLAICLTPNARGEHAYFPALFICIAFADLMSGLYAGTLEDQGLEELRRYAEKFMEAEYTSDPLRLDILYEFLRHKIAHLAYPYVVFDTDTKPTFKGQPRRFVTWIVDEIERRPAVDVVDLPTPRLFCRKLLRPGLYPITAKSRSVCLPSKSTSLVPFRNIFGIFNQIAMPKNISLDA